MGKQHDLITTESRDWISQQKLFLWRRAPLSDVGRINVSPKGGDSFRILGDLEAVYHDRAAAQKPALICEKMVASS